MPEDQKSRVDIPASLAVCEKATPGRWVCHFRGDGSGSVYEAQNNVGDELALLDDGRCPYMRGEVRYEDGVFAVAARDPETGWPATLKELEAARAELKRQDTPVAVENERSEGFRGLCACGLDTEGPKFCGNCGCPLDWSKA